MGVRSPGRLGLDFIHNHQISPDYVALAGTFQKH